LAWATIANLKTLCEEHLKGRYDLEVIDIYQEPTLAQIGQIIATPTLLKKLPPPQRKLIGDMSNTREGPPGTGHPGEDGPCTVRVKRRS
jgi:hypothetical protein